MMENDRVKAQIENSMRGDIVELYQQDSVLYTILDCKLDHLVAPITTTLVPAAQSDRTHLPGCLSLVGSATPQRRRYRRDHIDTLTTANSS
jgi:hypothetical protein